MSPAISNVNYWHHMWLWLFTSLEILLIVHHPLGSENMWCLVFCSVLVCWELWFPALSMSLQRMWTHPFLWLHSISWCIYTPHFLYPVYHWWAFGLIPCLCCCEQCCSEHTRACIFVIEWFIFLWIYNNDINTITWYIIYIM